MNRQQWDCRLADFHQRWYYYFSFPQFGKPRVRHLWSIIIKAPSAIGQRFENGGFTLKTHQMLSVHTTPKEFENATINGHFVVEETSVRDITWLSWRCRFRKAPSFFKTFPVITKTRSQRLQINPVWRVFSKSSIFKVFSAYTKTKSRRYQISPVWRTFFEKIRFRDGLWWTDGN